MLDEEDDFEEQLEDGTDTTSAFVGTKMMEPLDALDTVTGLWGALSFAYFMLLLRLMCVVDSVILRLGDSGMDLCRVSRPFVLELHGLGDDLLLSAAASTNTPGGGIICASNRSRSVSASESSLLPSKLSVVLLLKKLRRFSGCFSNVLSFGGPTDSLDVISIA